MGEQNVKSVPYHPTELVIPGVRAPDEDGMMGLRFGAAAIAAMMSVTEQTVRAWVKRGQIPIPLEWMGTGYWSRDQVMDIVQRGPQPDGTYSKATAEDIATASERMATAAKRKKQRETRKKKTGKGLKDLEPSEGHS